MAKPNAMLKEYTWDEINQALMDKGIAPKYIADILIILNNNREESENNNQSLIH